MERDRWAEAAMCQLHVAALLSEYLYFVNKTEEEETDPRKISLRRPLPLSLKEFKYISPNFEKV